MNKRIKLAAGTVIKQERISPPPKSELIVSVQYKGPPFKVLKYPPPPHAEVITILNNDFARLTRGNPLNDTLVDFYLQYIFREKLFANDREKTHIFNSFFYTRLSMPPVYVDENREETQRVLNHWKVKNWTRNIDIFSKDFLIIPACDVFCWFLIVICFPANVPDGFLHVISMSDAEVSRSTGNMSTNDKLTTVKNDVITESDAEVSRSTGNVMSTNDKMTAVKDDVIAESDAKVSRSIDNVLSANEKMTAVKDENSESHDEKPTNSSNKFSHKGTQTPIIVQRRIVQKAPDGNVPPYGNDRLKMPCIFIFDSNTNPNASKAADILRDYLDVEWEKKKGTRKIFNRNTMKCYMMKCPDQKNGVDCGIHLFLNFDKFFQNPYKIIANPMANLKNWYTEDEVCKKREQLKKLIVSLALKRPRMP